MPSFNSAPFIRKAIESVLNQDFNNWELIIVDDNSNDESWDIILEYKRKYKSIYGFKLKKNYGASYARNYAIRESKGRYIAFLDSDDYWLSNKLKSQYLVLKKFNAPIVCSNYFCKKYKESKSENIIRSKKIIFLKDILKTNDICTSTAVYDSYILGKQYMPNLIQRHDWALWIKILKLDANYYALCLNDPLAVRIQHKVSLSSNILRSIYFNFRKWP